MLWIHCLCEFGNVITFLETQNPLFSMLCLLQHIFRLMCVHLGLLSIYSLNFRKCLLCCFVAETNELWSIFLGACFIKSKIKQKPLFQLVFLIFFAYNLLAKFLLFAILRTFLCFFFFRLYSLTGLGILN